MPKVCLDLLVRHGVRGLAEGSLPAAAAVSHASRWDRHGELTSPQSLYDCSEGSRRNQIALDSQS